MFFEEERRGKGKEISKEQSEQNSVRNDTLNDGFRVISWQTDIRIFFQTFHF